MRSLILAMVFGAAVHAQVPRGSPGPAKPDGLTQFKNQLDNFAAQAEAAKNGTPLMTPQQSWKFFAEPRSVPAAPPVKPPKVRIRLMAAQPCAIPLRNVLRGGNVDPKMILPAGPPVDAKIQIVAPPAPSCDDVK